MKHKLLNGWTQEKAIATLRQHLPSDGSRCMDELEISCAYFSRQGYRCAAGAFLPESIARHEHGTIDGVIERNPGVLAEMPLDVSGMLDLQREHDKTNPSAGESAIERCVAFILEETEETIQ
jgi:hypothetical protein